MSQRLIRSSQRLTEEIALINGIPFLPIKGSEDDDDKTGDNKTGDDDGDDDDDDDKDDKPKGVSQEAYDKLKRRMQAADRAKNEAVAKAKKADELQAKIDEIEGKDKTDGEKALADLTKSQGDLDKVTKNRDELKERNQELLIENAFLKNTKFKWHDVNAAMKLLDLDDVEIDDDGEIDGLDKAIKALAKSHAFLIKDDDEDDEDRQPVGAGASGFGGGGGSTKRSASQQQQDRNRIAAKYRYDRR